MLPHSPPPPRQLSPEIAAPLSDPELPSCSCLETSLGPELERGPGTEGPDQDWAAGNCEKSDSAPAGPTAASVGAHEGKPRLAREGDLALAE